MQLDSKVTLNITTESIFEDPEGIIELISRKFSINRKYERFINYRQSTKDKSKDTDYYKDYYLTEKWRMDVTSEAIAIINETVDKELMSHFGYSVLT